MIYRLARPSLLEIIFNRLCVFQTFMIIIEIFKTVISFGTHFRVCVI